MKMILVAIISMISILPAFSAEDEICGRFIVSEDVYEGKPSNEFLGLPGTMTSWTKYYLKPRGKVQKQLLHSMEEGRDYCITGTLFWCGDDKQYRCSTIKTIKLER